MKLTSLLTATLAFALTANLHAEHLKLGYSDWPGYTVMEVAVQKGWFKDAGVDVEMVWFDYSASIDAFGANKIDGDMIVASDALVSGGAGAKSKIIALVDFSEGSDMIVGAPGVESIKDLKGKKIGIEKTLVEHLLLMQALKENGMKATDVELVGTPTNDTPQVLASGKVSAIGAWYPVSGQALKSVANSKPLYTSAEAKGLIYDVIAVNPISYGKHKEDWAKIAGVFYKCVDYLKDPKTADDAIKIMAAKVKADAADYAKNIPGTHFLPLAEAKTAFKKGDGLDSIYGSMAIANKFNMDNKVYKVSQKPENYLVPSVVAGLK